MRLAAIDVGSNSVHMVIADVTGDGHVQVVDRVKEMVRLGRKSFMTGTLTSETTELAERAVTTFSRLARARHVQHIRAVATSAVREAKNGQAFVRRLKADVEGEIDVAGPDLARSLGDLGLVDEYRLYLRPVVLGGGTPFFAGPRPPLHLVASDLIADDFIRLTYVPA